jgi:hypothetical protein
MLGRAASLPIAVSSIIFYFLGGFVLQIMCLGFHRRVQGAVGHLMTFARPSHCPKNNAIQLNLLRLHCSAQQSCLFVCLCCEMLRGISASHGPSKQRRRTVSGLV